MTIRYYAITGLDRNPDDPYSVFREVSEPGRDYRTELWDREAGAWREQMSLMTYIFFGELGAEEITRAQARRLLRRWTGRGGRC